MGILPNTIPVMVFGRLTVDVNWQGKQIGIGILKDAIQRTIIIAEQAKESPPFQLSSTESG